MQFVSWDTFLEKSRLLLIDSIDCPNSGTGHVAASNRAALSRLDSTWRGQSQIWNKWLQPAAQARLMRRIDGRGKEYGEANRPNKPDLIYTYLEQGRRLC